MADGTGIEWTDASWNVVTGCEFESPGCANCYAMRMARRLDGQGKGYDGTTRMTKAGPVWSGQVNLHPDRLEIPLRWRKPRMVFPCSMSDLFHPNVPFPFIAAVYGVMCYAERHTFQVLTKRAERAAEFYDWIQRPDSIRFEADADGEWPMSPAQRCLMAASALAKARWNGPMFGIHLVSHIKPEPDAPITKKWPLPNVWLGVSVEDQRRADERIPHLLRCPAAVRWLSCEPLLGPLSFRWRPYHHEATGETYREYLERTGCVNEYESLRGIQWIVGGGETGVRSRPSHTQWFRDLRDQCQEAGVAYFHKQNGDWLDAFTCYQMGLLGEGRTYPDHRWPDESTSFRVKKKHAGRLLDGREWNQFPEVAHA